MANIAENKAKRLTSAKDLLLSHDWLVQREKSAKYVTKEHQDYGLRLATRLNDPEHKSLYIKLAKEEHRAILEKAASFAFDYPNASNKGKIFMWKLKELRAEYRTKQKDEKEKQLNLV